MLDGLQKVLGNDAGWNEQGSWSQVGWAKQRQEGYHPFPGKNMIAFNFLSGSSLFYDMAISTIIRYRRSWRGLLESCRSVRHWACEDLAGSPSSSLTRSKTWVVYIILLFTKEFETLIFSLNLPLSGSSPKWNCSACAKLPASQVKKKPWICRSKIS